MSSVRTLSKGEQTRERLLDLAQDGVLEKGFAATSIEELIAGAGITKSGFFYHFSDKADLAKALLERYIQRHEDILDNLFTQADALSEDKLQSFLIGLKMFADMLGNLRETHPGCIVAAFCYQEYAFSREVRELNAAGVRSWRARVRRRLEEIAAIYPPRDGADLDSIADGATALVEGGIILAKALSDNELLSRQVMLYRHYVKLVFEPVRAQAAR